MVTNEEFKQVIFVCEENEEQARLAQQIFSEEAIKSDLAWSALPWNSSTNNFDQATLIISLSSGKQISPIVQKMNIGKDRVEAWDGNFSSDFIEKQIKNLIVRLILKGGKRKSTEIQERCKTCLKP
ncbi:MAG: hypothetical protein K2X81_15285, partial [Candidatus Obscuribacterales bacterium]|nr:hypothetical protein [Candidatus Obscuribacterales bacterium]